MVDPLERYFDSFSDFFFCFSWVPGISLLFLWSYFGLGVLRWLQASAVVVSLLLFCTQRIPAQIVGTFLFVLTRSISYGSIDYATESECLLKSLYRWSLSDFERWRLYRHNKPNRVKHISEPLLPVLHFLMMPYAEYLVELLQKEQHLEHLQRRPIHFFSSPKVLIRCNLIWAAVGVCVLVLTLVVEAWLTKAFATEFDEMKKSHRDIWADSEWEKFSVH